MNETHRLETSVIRFSYRVVCYFNREFRPSSSSVSSWREVEHALADIVGRMDLRISILFVEGANHWIRETSIAYTFVSLIGF